MMKRLGPIDAAKDLINEKFSECQGAVLAGSVIRGEATSTSDLDIVIFCKHLDASYRESFTYKGWPVEIFVHNLSSYKNFFKMDCDSGKPSMPTMVSEGMIFKDEGVMSSIREEAKYLLKKGPAAWSQDTIDTQRYFITNLIDDLIGSDIRYEQIFIVNTLSDRLQEFVLRMNGQWIGSSKWAFRALDRFDRSFATTFMDAFEAFYQSGEINQIIQLTDSVLEPYGGRLFDGFSLGKENQKRSV